MYPKSIQDIILKKKEEGLSYGQISNFSNISRKSVGSIFERASKNKRKTGPKPKINARTGGKKTLFIQQKTDNIEKVFASTENCKHFAAAPSQALSCMVQ